MLCEIEIMIDIDFDMVQVVQICYCYSPTQETGNLKGRLNIDNFFSEYHSRVTLFYFSDYFNINAFEVLSSPDLCVYW